MARIVETEFWTLKEWRDAVKAAGQYMIDNADKIIAEGEKVKSVNITLKGIERASLPVLGIEKEYNVIEMMKI